MDVFQVVALALVTAVLLVVLRQQRPELALILSVAAGALIFILLASKIGAVVGVFRDLAANAEVDLIYVGTMLRVIGVAYLAEFGAQVCRDAGEGSMASKVELAGKVAILLLAAPVILAIMRLVLRLLP